MNNGHNTERTNSSGFAVILMLFLMVAVIGIIVMYLFAQTRQAKDLDPEEQTVTTYEDCVAAGGAPRMNVDLGSFICYLNTKRNSAYPAMFDRCTIESCPDIKEAFFSYCNQEHAKSIHKSGAQFLLAYASVKVKGSYARGDIYCYLESETNLLNATPLHVFLHKTDEGWVFEKIVSDSFECQDFDGTNIPVAIVGPCYDVSTGSFRGPR